jgi:signal transduction histidine kinase/DNA-binding response OmpR family regulator
MTTAARRILIVDDNEAIHEDIKSTLTGTGIEADPDRDTLAGDLFDEAPSRTLEVRYRIDDAYQGEEAVAAVEAAAAQGAPYALIFMDVRMPPGIDGVQTITRIWKKHPQTEIVLCTAFSDHTWDDILNQLGTTEHLLFIRKPFDSVSVKQLALTLTTKWMLDRQNRGYILSLAESRERYKTLVDNLGVGVMLLDCDMNITTANAQLKRWYPAIAESTSQKCCQALAGQEQSHFCRNCPATRTIEDGCSHEVMADVTLPCGVRHQRIQSFPVSDPTGALRGAIVVCEDITERIAMEERIANTRKMELLGRIASGVAHDLNNILAGLITLPDLLLLEMPSNSSSTEYLQMIKDSAGRAAAIVEDLLTLSRRSAATHTVINLNAIITTCLNSPEFTTLRGEHPQVTITRDCDVNLHCIRGSEVHLQKSLMNLLVNAVQAIPETGTITITTRNTPANDPALATYDHTASDYVTLRIADSGVGIPSESLVKIFEPFYTTKVMGRRSGTGLGLAIVDGTIKDHHGFIAVESAIGKGTQFTLHFPATLDRSSGAGPTPVPDVQRGNGQTILVVEENIESRAILSFMLGKLGYHPHIVGCGDDAITYLQTKNAELIILDMILDYGMDGLETFKRILMVKPDARAIITSGFARTDRITEVQTLASGRLIPKPYTLGQIAEAISEELAKQ